jgi:coproporphyrinogen III oxidase
MIQAWVIPTIPRNQFRCHNLPCANVCGSLSRHSFYMTETSAPRAYMGVDVGKFFEQLREAQTNMCLALEALDGHSKFSADPWSLETVGSGLTRVLQDGKLFEKAGVSISFVHGTLSEERARAMQTRGRKCEAGAKYQAAALSFVFHAQSPFIPTLRGDIRIFAMENEKGNHFWGGGGVDLTPVYIDETQISEFHQHWKRVCDNFDSSYYHHFKQQCDDYFYLPARGEWRGVGGLFFDDLVLNQDELVRFLITLSTEFVPSYQPILTHNRGLAWTPAQKRFQRIRRGRYIGKSMCQRHRVCLATVDCLCNRARPTDFRLSSMWS